MELTGLTGPTGPDDVTGELVALTTEALSTDGPAGDAEVVSAETIGALAALAAAPPPASLRDRVLGRALAARPAGTRPPVAPGDTTDPVAAFTRTAHELLTTLDGLGDEDWERPTVTYPSIRTLVAHLVAIETYFGGQLGLWDEVAPAGDDLDHVGLSQPFIAECAALPPAEVRARLRERLAAVCAALEGLGADGLDRTARFHALEAPLPAILIVRTFELWTHHEDVRRSTGQALAPPDPGRLTLMTETAVGALPLAMALTGTTAPGRTARIVLTGAGAGTWVTALGGDGAGLGAAPDVVLVADALEFCRLAARRVTPEELAVEVEGDGELAHRVLVGAAAFAAD